ncbi:MAG TPA: hypothetical protein PKH58_09620 [Paludibacteraceae bacterium]|mgnify:CR=1 FL=1|nr:hypothetical protein [Paludibacteraceae bacterium]HPT43198.1 hypothetical protein [Paludibacteraceae bacterium]
MNIFKLLSRLGQEVFSGGKAGEHYKTWFLNSRDNRERVHDHVYAHEVKRSLIRNGSRGEGVGMGHRNKKSTAK